MKSFISAAILVLACSNGWAEQAGGNKIIMEGYDGANYESTFVARTKSIQELIACEDIVINVAQWPDKIGIEAPTSKDGELIDDGDRGFVWRLSEKQVRVAIIAEMKKKKSLRVVIEKEEIGKADQIKKWAGQLGFASVTVE